MRGLTPGVLGASASWQAYPAAVVVARLVSSWRVGSSISAGTPHGELFTTGFDLTKLTAFPAGKDA